MTVSSKANAREWPVRLQFQQGWAAPCMPTAAPLQASARQASTFWPPGSPGSCSSVDQALSTLTTTLQPLWKLLEKALASCSKENSGRHSVCIRPSGIQAPSPKAAIWNIQPTLLCALPASLSPHSRPSALRGCLPNKLLTPKSLPRAVLWGKTRPRLLGPPPCTPQERESALNTYQAQNAQDK